MDPIPAEGAFLGSGVVVHGGAGDVPEARRALHAEGCREAAHEGQRIIARGGSALDAVQALSLIHI